MCRDREDSITHTMLENFVYLELWQTFGLVSKVKWQNHKPSSVVEKDKVKTFCDFNI